MDRLRHKNIYKSDSFERSKVLFLDHVLKSTKKASLKTKWTNMRIFHVQLLSQVDTENYSNQRAQNDNAHTILAPLNC